MNTKMSVNGIELVLEMDRPVVYIEGAGYSHPATLCGKYLRGDLNKLVGATMWSSRVLSVIAPVSHDKCNGTIGLILDKKHW